MFTETAMTHPVRHLVAVVAGALILGPIATAQVDDWPQWRGPNRDGVAPCTAWSAEGAETPLWRTNVGLGYSNVCLRGGRLITHGFDVASKRDVIVCPDALTGAEQWRHAYPSKINDTMHGGGTLTTPVAAGDRVFVLSRLGALRCLDLASGTVIWTRDLAADKGVDVGSFGLPATPLLLGEDLVINVGRTMRLDQATGTTRWETKDYGYSYSVPVHGLINDRPTLVVFNAAGLVTLNPATGDELSLFEWTSRFNVNAATPLIVDGRVFISTGYNDKGCAMLDYSSGAPTVAWKSMVISSKMTGCVLFENHLYGFDDEILRCIDLEGTRRWQQRGLGNGAVLASADGRLVVLSEEGELVIARAQPDGWEELSRTTLFEGGKCWTTPVLSGGLIFCRNSLGELVCVDHRVSDG